jgi:O-antigen/teichoic acid export membrane protein
MAMVHPIFSVLVSRPELVVDHLTGYAALAQQEASTLGKEMVQRAIAWGVAAVSFVVFLVLAGVAVMLGAIDGFHWVLVLAPGVALALGIGALGYARKVLPGQAFSELRGQLEADAQALRMAGARS